MALGYFDSENIWRHGEDDSYATMSARLDKGQPELSTLIGNHRTRLVALETTSGTALPGSGTAGQKFLLTTTMVLYRHNGSAWIAWESDWITYTPTLANTTLGSGTKTGFYRYIGGDVDTKGAFILGAGSAIGTGPTVTNPVNASASSILQAFPLGECRIGDAGTALYPGLVAPVSATISQFFALNTAVANGAAVQLTSTVPIAAGAGTGDSLSWRYRYAPA